MSNKELIEELSSVLEPQDAKVFSGWSMSLNGLVLLSHEIRLRKRKTIIEFGSGASSIVMARSVQKYNSGGGKIISVENQPYYCNDLNNFVRKNGLHEIIKFIYAPLGPCPYLLKNKWYAQRALNAFIDRQNKFDMVVIDGPPAWNDRIKLSRYGAIHFIIDRLANDYSIFLDDAKRSGEKEIMELWKARFKITFAVINERIAVSRNKILSVKRFME
jgi:predicted O-methyltransferase YrrM